MANIDEHVLHYQRSRSLYEAYASRLHELLKALLDGSGIVYHVIESRAKAVDSFRDKIARPGKHYADPLGEVTDLAGCRVIAYYADDVGRIGKLIENEFNVVEAELSHQPEHQETDRFGYVSAHYVVDHGGKRSQLAEWRPYADLRAEIQVRTVIQHAWSAVSHAVQYKQESAVPSMLQRRLHRIAGLFELADEEFVAIREQKRQAHQLAVDKVARQPESTPITMAVVQEIFDNWTKKEELVKRAGSLGFSMVHSGGEDTLASVVPVAKSGGLKHAEEIIEIISKPNYSKLRGIAATSPHGSWQVDEEFLFLLLIIAAVADKIDADILVKDGSWDRGIAQRTIDAARS